VVVFPGRFPLLCCCSACVLGCSHYFMTSLALFSLSRPPHSPSPSPSPSPSSSLSPSPRPPHNLLSRPPDIIPFHRALPSASLSPRATLGSHLTTPVLVISLERVRPNLPWTTAYHYTCLQPHPIACSIGNGLDLWPPLPDLSFSLPPYSTSPQVRKSAVPPRSTRTYSTVYIQYT
jgi:hypothetical protein